MTVRIRDARNVELDDVSALMVTAYGQYEAELPAHLWEDYRAEIADVRRRMPFSQLIVAEHENALCGAVTFYPDATKSEHLGWPEGFTEVRLLSVDPAARGLGIGRLLTDECIRRAKDLGAHTIGLHTSYLMWVARDMYERMGFVRAPEFDFVPEPNELPDLVAIAYRLEI
ncbi:MAG TPA: GNAT family N-acetyltransferase [Actinomycetota bacterium]|nr:GNAT family N-acetyltransferase [Actinomycetota bacterium]